MDQDNGLVQHPFKSNAELWSKDQLRHSWSGKVIILSAPLLKFDLAWFIPAFWQHRRMLAEIFIVNQKGTSKLRQKGTNLLKIFYAILPPDLDLLIR